MIIEHIARFKNITNARITKIYMIYIYIFFFFQAPFSEEFIFRACMLPLLVPCFGTSLSVFLCPLFFGVGM